MICNSVSPLRQYVAMGRKEGGGIRFQIFMLPESSANNGAEALRYFQNTVAPGVQVDGVITLEEYLDIRGTDQKPLLPEFQADADAHLDVANDLTCQRKIFVLPERRIWTDIHLEMNLQRHNPGGDAGYAKRYKQTYRESYARWLALHEVYRQRTNEE